MRPPPPPPPRYRQSAAPRSAVPRARARQPARAQGPARAQRPTPTRAPARPRAQGPARAQRPAPARAQRPAPARAQRPARTPARAPRPIPAPARAPRPIPAPARAPRPVPARQPAGLLSRSARPSPWPILAVVLELERDLDVERAQATDHPLERVLVLAPDPNGIALDLRLHLGELVPDQLGQLLGDIVGQAAPEGDDLLDRVAAGRLDLAPVEDLQAEVSPDCLRLDQVLDHRCPEVVVGDQDELGLLLLDLDPGALEVEALLDLASNLVQGVPKLLLIEIADHIERDVTGHEHAPSVRVAWGIGRQWYPLRYPRSMRVTFLGQAGLFIE